MVSPEAALQRDSKQDHNKPTQLDSAEVENSFVSLAAVGFVSVAPK